MDQNELIIVLLQTIRMILMPTRLGVDKVKPKRWFKFFDRQVVGTILKLSYFLNFLWDTWLKVIGGVGGFGGWVGWLAPNIFALAPGILKMVHKVRLKMFSLKMVDYSMSLLLLST